MIIPKHYDKKVQPWDLERCMESSGDAFVDSRRTDIIEYVFRKKDNMLEDLKKARHCLDAAIERMESNEQQFQVATCASPDTRCGKCGEIIPPICAIFSDDGYGSICYDCSILHR